MSLELLRQFHDSHDCQPAKCICKCGCSQMLGCTVVLGPLCSVCMTNANWDDSEHGLPPHPTADAAAHDEKV